METNPDGACHVAGCIGVAVNAVRLFEGVRVDGADASVVVRFCTGHAEEATGTCRLLTGEPRLELVRDDDGEGDDGPR